MSYDWKTCQWHKEDLRPCTSVASRFFLSTWPASEGVIPRNRTLCHGCANRFTKIGGMVEVTRPEWEVAQVLTT